MGVLKKITDEYFEKTLRKEDGKFLDVFGCRVKVPADYDEDKFIEKIAEILHGTSAIFTSIGKTEYDMLRDKDFHEIRCNDEFVFMMNPFGSFSVPKVEEKVYESYMKFMRHILKDVEICFIDDSDGGEYCILLVSGDETGTLNENDDREDEEYAGTEILDPAMGPFFKEFGGKAHIIRSEIVEDSESGVVGMMTNNISGHIQIKTLIYAKEMREWWKEKVDEILDKGVAAFFEESEEE